MGNLFFVMYLSPKHARNLAVKILLKFPVFLLIKKWANAWISDIEQKKVPWQHDLSQKKNILDIFFEFLWLLQHSWSVPLSIIREYPYWPLPSIFWNNQGKYLITEYKCLKFIWWYLIGWNTLNSLLVNIRAG